MTKKNNPTVDFLRIIPRSNDFLDRRVGSRGEIFFDNKSNNFRLYDGSNIGGKSLITNDITDIRESLISAKISTIKYIVNITGPQESDIGNKYTINGIYKPTLKFVIGYTYIFDQSDPQNVYFPNSIGTTPNPHPLNFSSNNLNGVSGNGNVYLTDVIYKLNNNPVSYETYNSSSFIAATSRSVQITVTDQTPSTLYYWCYNHLNMGNNISVSEPGTTDISTTTGSTTVTVSDSLPSDPTNGNLWLNTNNGVLYVYIDDGDSEQWIQPSAPLNLNNLTLDNTTLTSVNSIGFQAGVTINGFSVDGTFSNNSNSIVPVESAVKTYVDTAISSQIASEISSAVVNILGNAPSDLNTLGEIASAIDNDANFYTTINSALATKSPINNPSFDGIATFSSISEIVTPLSNSSSTVIHDFSLTSIFYHENIADDFTANFTNVPTTNNRTFGVALILEQGSTAYLSTAVEINGNSETINWQGAELPSGTPNNIDLVSFTFVRVNNSWTVIGSISTYG
jgi:hypothetical protein